MFRNQHRLIALTKMLEALHMAFIERSTAADGKADAMYGQRHLLAQGGQLCM